jgi:hypothetical protein
MSLANKFINEEVGLADLIKLRTENKTPSVHFSQYYFESLNKYSITF